MRMSEQETQSLCGALACTACRTSYFDSNNPQLWQLVKSLNFFKYLISKSVNGLNSKVTLKPQSLRQLWLQFVIVDFVSGGLEHRLRTHGISST